jgi:hypothetical protein
LSHRDWLLLGKLGGDADRRLMAVNYLIVDALSSILAGGCRQET